MMQKTMATPGNITPPLPRTSTASASGSATDCCCCCCYYYDDDDNDDDHQQEEACEIPPQVSLPPARPSRPPSSTMPPRSPSTAPAKSHCHHELMTFTIPTMMIIITTTIIIRINSARRHHHQKREDRSKKTRTDICGPATSSSALHCFCFNDMLLGECVWCWRSVAACWCSAA